MDAEVECKCDRVKLIAMSDLHAQTPKVEVGRYDVCVIAGDFSSGVIRDNDVRDSFSWLSGEGRDWLNQHGNVQFVIVPGNHDLAMVEKRKAKDFGWSDNAHLLIDIAALREAVQKGLIDFAMLGDVLKRWQRILMRSRFRRRT